MKKLILIVMCCIPALAMAVSPGHRQAAEELLSVSGMKGSMDKMIDNMLTMQVQRNPNMLPYKDIMMKFLRKYLSFENIRGDFISIYTEEFTEGELRKITAFYRTPVGQKTIQRMPALMRKGAQVGVSKVVAHMGELQAMIKAEAEKNKKKQMNNNTLSPTAK